MLEKRPYPGEHSARLKDPGQYDEFRRENDRFGKGIHAIWGIKTEPERVVELQAIRFDAKIFTVEEAKKWLEEHGYQPIEFEPAIEEKTIKTQVFYRTAEINKEEINKEDRTIELSFSSEMPVERFFGIEILDHDVKSVRLGRLNQGGALLIQHDPDDVVGVIEEAYISSDRKGRARVRFGKSARAEEIFQDVLDGIRTNVSVGYQIHEMVTDGKQGGGGGKVVYRAVDWEPLEISIVSIPADISVGIGRDLETKVLTNVEGGEKKMEDVKIDVEKIRNEAKKAEAERVKEILAIGKFHNCAELAEKAVQEGTSLDTFRQTVLETVYRAKPTEPLELGMSEKEVQSFSIVRAIRAMMEMKLNGTDPKRIAPFEMEASRATAERMKKEPHGFFIPYDVTMRSKIANSGISKDSVQRIAEYLITRDLEKGAGSAGGYTVATDLLAANFIDLLRNAMMVRKLGAQVLSGLVGDVAIPKQTGGATAYWVAESGAPTESQQTFGQLGLTPKTCGAFTDISRKLILQSSIDVEAFVRSDLATVLALAIDLAAITGTGSNNQPRGILNTTGIGDVAIGDNGGAPTYSHIVSLWKEIAIDNAAVGNLAFLTNSVMIAKLLNTPKVSGYPAFVIESLPDAEGFTTMLGLKTGMSNQVPRNLVKGTSNDCSAIICGNWADLIIAEWGALDVLVDPYTGGAAGTVRVRVLQDVDIALRNAESFAAIKDARDV